LIEQKRSQPVTSDNHQERNCLTSQREIAKLGMLGALGVLVWTGMQRRRYTGLHLGAGVALLGFTLWHCSLYPNHRPHGAAHAQPAALPGQRGEPNGQAR
jgi:hypothetical protein